MLARHGVGGDGKGDNLTSSQSASMAPGRQLASCCESGARRALIRRVEQAHVWMQTAYPAGSRELLSYATASRRCSSS